MAIDALDTLVSSAIWRAEQLDELGLDTTAAWGEVSKLEEELAKKLPAKEIEGRIARRGAVRAALKSTDHVRAQDLVERYVAERGVPKGLSTELREMLKADVKALTEQFPFATKHHKPNEFQTLANWFLETGPFGLAMAV
jgi:hypothetical protein